DRGARVRCALLLRMQRDLRLLRCGDGAAMPVDDERFGASVREDANLDLVRAHVDELPPDGERDRCGRCPFDRRVRVAWFVARLARGHEERGRSDHDEDGSHGGQYTGRKSVPLSRVLTRRGTYAYTSARRLRGEEA